MIEQNVMSCGYFSKKIYHLFNVILCWFHIFNLTLWCVRVMLSLIQERWSRCGTWLQRHLQRCHEKSPQWHNNIYHNHHHNNSHNINNNNNKSIIRKHNYDIIVNLWHDLRYDLNIQCGLVLALNNIIDIRLWLNTIIDIKLRLNINIANLCDLNLSILNRLSPWNNTNSVKHNNEYHNIGGHNNNRYNNIDANNWSKLFGITIWDDISQHGFYCCVSFLVVVSCDVFKWKCSYSDWEINC